MSGIAPGPDPSMEDILASIRRILDEDQSAVPPAADGAPAPMQAAEASDTVEQEFVLDDSMLEPGSPPAPEPMQFSGPIHQPTDLESQAAHETAFAAGVEPAPIVPAPLPYETEPQPMSADSDVSASPAAPPPEPANALLGAQASQVTASSMMNLVRAVTADRASMVRAAGPSIEDVVREELRPLLKDWLETHLPPLVERLVRAEIERVVNRATF